MNNMIIKLNGEEMEIRKGALLRDVISGDSRNSIIIINGVSYLFSEAMAYRINVNDTIDVIDILVGG